MTGMHSQSYMPVIQKLQAWKRAGRKVLINPLIGDGDACDLLEARLTKDGYLHLTYGSKRRKNSDVLCPLDDEAKVLRDRICYLSDGEPGEIFPA